MAKSWASFLFIMLLFFTSGGVLKPGNAQKTWCVVKPSTEKAALQDNINYACSQSRVDCSVLKQGCSCYTPDNLMNHASVAMNLYYQANGRNKWNCDFKNSGLIVITNPSYGGCIYP